VKFLIDENLSPRIIAATDDLFPGSTHVANVGLARAADARVWEHARTNGFAILSKDADFHQLSFLYGHPPKVVWPRIANASTQQIIDLLQRRAAHIQQFNEDPAASFLALS